MIVPIGSVALVAIGRNEGERLEACLRSAVGAAGVVVYVDSGSTDGSPGLAAARGAQVVALNPATPFTAARARNAGAAAARAVAGDGLRFIQFVDGDCALDPGWVPAATAFLDARPDVGAVCGRRRERRPEASIYNRLCDMEWNTPVGEARSCGGDVMIRVEAFDAAGGYDPSMIAGEDPELCVRLRAAGWKVWRLDREMTRHDAAILRFGQWWRRAFRGGWAYCEGAARHGAPPERHNVAGLRSILVWGAAAPALAGAFGLAALGAAATGAAWSAPALGAVLAVAAYPAMAARIAIGRRRRFGDRWRDACVYGMFTMIGKPAQALGALRAWRDRRRTGQAALIEYKSAR